MGFFLLTAASALAQDKAIGDSLERVFTNGQYPPGQRLDLLRDIAINHPDTQKKLLFSELLIEAAGAVDSADYLLQGYVQKGNALRLKGNLTPALESYLRAASIAEKIKSQKRLATVNVAIADVYAIMGNHATAVRYHKNAIEVLRLEKDSINLASGLLNAGDEYINYGRLDTALLYTVEAETIFRMQHHIVGQAYALGNLGMIYAKLGNNLQAEANMNLAILLLEDKREYYPIAVYLAYISDIYLRKSEYNTALTYAQRSLELARKHGLKDQVSDACLRLSRIYEQKGMAKEALTFYKEHIAYKDSVTNIASVQRMADQRTEFEVSRKQMEVDLLSEQKKNQQIILVFGVIALLLIVLLAVGLYRRYTYIRETNRIIDREKQRSDELLLNILPEETARELKENGRVMAKKFDSVTVLFADFKGFTQYAERMSPEELVKTVDHYFSAFDEIVAKHGLEKIKTVGDAYMCAGGLPFPTEDHALKMVQAALDMVAFVEREKQLTADSRPRFDVRIGINTGPVVAGVVGTRKFAYDIWGDTVNVASRLETASDPGRINISEETYTLIKDQMECEFRGEMEVKNRGELRMYFVLKERLMRVTA